MNRAQRRAAARNHRPTASFTPFTGLDFAALDGPSFNRLVRSSCTDCGATDLRWMPIPELFDHLPADQHPDLRDLVAQLDGAEGEAWLCFSCSAYGVLGGWERG